MSSHKASERGSPASSLLARISASLDALRKSERAVADFVLAHPDQVLQLSIAELAAHAGVSQPTVARFARSEEHTSELQSLMRISYAVFCLKKKNHTRYIPTHMRTSHTAIY